MKKTSCLASATIFLFSLILATLANAASVKLNWNASIDPDLAGYNVLYQEGVPAKPFVGTGAAEGPSPVVFSNTTSAVISGLDSNRTYYFAVTAYNSSGVDSPYSNIVSVCTSCTGTYAINASSGTGGTITPSSTAVNAGSSQLYSISPSVGYVIKDVKVDGVSVGAVSQYSFLNVTSPHSISSTFEPITYPIYAWINGNGSISCSPQVVSNGGSSTCTLSLGEGFLADSLTDNGENKLASLVGNTYTISNVTGSHTIYASTSLPIFSITATAGTGGSITPAGTTYVTYGGSQSFTITPNAGYRIADVVVDGVSKGKNNNYAIYNAQDNHEINVIFSNSIPVYQFLDINTGYHFYTSSELEKNSLIPYISIWKLQGIAFLSYPNKQAETTPVYRFVNLINNQFYYTASETEKNSLTLHPAIWKLQGIVFYAFPLPQLNSKPVYRFINLTTGQFFYTTNESEKNTLQTIYSSTWKFQCIAFYVPTQ